MSSINFSKRLSQALKTRVPKRYRNGTHRSVAPDVTVRTIMPLTARFGITRVANVTGLDWLGVPVVMVCRPNSRSLSVSQGKGLTLDAAKASGLMESIELYHAEHIALPMKVGSVHEMSKRHNVVEVDQLQYVNRLRYHEHRELLWAEGHDLLHDQSIWVPYECVSNNAVGFHLPGQTCFGMTSNGLASGNHLLEAIAHAICEVVERDATTLWYCRTAQARKASCVDLDRCEDLNCKQLIARFRESGLQALVWETTSDIGLPSFLCLLHEGDSNPSRLPYTSVGMGCHVSPSIALLRATTESAQSRLTLIAGSRDDMFRDQYEQSRFRANDLVQYRSLEPSKNKGRSLKTMPSFDRETFNEDLELILEKLESAGIKQVVVVALTESDSPFQVVKIIIPGLEGLDDHPRYSPGFRVHQLRNGSL